MDITQAQFWNVPNVQGLPSFSYAELLAQLTQDIPGGAGSIGIGCEVSNNGGFNCPDTVALQQLDFNISGFGGNVSYDDAGFYTDAESNVFTIPNITPAIQRVRAWFFIRWTGNTTGFRFVRTETNLSPAFPGHMFDTRPGLATDTDTCHVSDAIPVVAGDKISFHVKQTSGGNLLAGLYRGGLTVVK